MAVRRQYRNHARFLSHAERVQRPGGVRLDVATAKRFGRPRLRVAHDTGGAKSVADETPNLCARVTSEWSVRLVPFSSRFI
jgi:hypothetical protein